MPEQSFAAFLDEQAKKPVAPPPEPESFSDFMAAQEPEAPAVPQVPQQIPTARPAPTPVAQPAQTGWLPTLYRRMEQPFGQPAQPNAAVTPQVTPQPFTPPQPQPGRAVPELSIPSPDAAVASANEIAQKVVAIAQNPPPVPPAPIPHGLQTPEQQAAGRGQLAGEAEPPSPFGPPVEAGAGAAMNLDPTGRLGGAYRAARGAGAIATGPDTRARVEGARNVIGGAMDAAMVPMVGAAIKAPVRMGLTLGAGTVTQAGVEAGLKRLGLPEHWAGLAGDVAGILAGVGTHEAISPKALAAIRTLIESRLRRGAGTSEPQYTTTGQRIRRQGEPAYPRNAPGEARPNNPPSARKTAARPEVPVHGIDEQVMRVAHARENLSQQFHGVSWSDLDNPDRLAIDELIREGYGQSVTPLERPAKKAAPLPPAKPHAAERKAAPAAKTTETAKEPEHETQTPGAAVQEPAPRINEQSEPGGEPAAAAAADGSPTAPGGASTPAVAAETGESAVPAPAVEEAPAKKPDRFPEALHADPERYFAEYERRFGNVLNADNAATLFDDYNADPVGNRAAVHAAATEIRDTLFQRRVAAPAPSGKQGVVLTAGGNASGKSTIAALTDARDRVVLDSTLSNVDHARRLVDLALEHGKPVLILHADRPLDQAFRGMLERSAEEGRVVSIRQMINSQRGAANTVRELQQEYADDPRVQFRFYDNSGTEPHETTRLPEPQSYSERSGELGDILDSEFHAGRISEAAYRKIRGSEGNRGAPPVRGRGGPEGGGGIEETPPREIPGAIPERSRGARSGSPEDQQIAAPSVTAAAKKRIEEIDRQIGVLREGAAKREGKGRAPIEAMIGRLEAERAALATPAETPAKAPAPELGARLKRIKELREGGMSFKEASAQADAELAAKTPETTEAGAPIVARIRSADPDGLEAVIAGYFPNGMKAKQEGYSVAFRDPDSGKYTGDVRILATEAEAREYADRTLNPKAEPEPAKTPAATPERKRQASVLSLMSQARSLQAEAKTETGKRRDKLLNDAIRLLEKAADLDKLDDADAALAAAKTKTPAPKAETEVDPVTRELREDLGVSAENLAAYDPEKAVFKLGRHWLYKTLQGNDGPSFDTKREAVEGATRHKELKQAQFDNPEGYTDITRVRARKALALIRKYMDQGMSEMEAGERAHREVEPAQPPEAPAQPPAAEPEAPESKEPDAEPAETPETPEPAVPGPGVLPGGEGGEVTQPRKPKNADVSGAATEVFAEGREQPYRARYVVRELSDTYPSHNPFTFERNPDFHWINDRDYKLPKNQARVIKASGVGFRAVRVINTNPDAINGPSIIDADGNVLGGNNRRMSLERVYELNPKGAEAYRAMLMDKAAQFGIDPAQIEGMKRPALFREIIDPIDPQKAITEFNQDPAADLSMGEQAAADARGITAEMGKYIAQVMDAAGPDATLVDVLNSARGADIVNYLHREGLFTQGELPTLLDANTGKVTGAAKERIAKMLIGGLFGDSREFQAAPPSLRNKLERAAPILKSLEGGGGWDLTPDVKDALRMMAFEREYGKAFGVKPGEAFLIKSPFSEAQGESEYQSGMFGEGEGGRPTPPAMSDRARRIGAFIHESSGRAITNAFREFAEKRNEKSLFNDPDPDDAFAAAFGEKPPAAPEAPPPEAPPPPPEGGGLFGEPEGGGLFGSERGSLPFTPGKFLTEDVAPTVRNVADGIRQVWDDFIKFASPTLYDKYGRMAGLILRGKLGEQARRMAQARKATAAAERYFNRQPAQENYDFIDRMENGKKQPTPELDTIATALRRFLDEAKGRVQGLGTGKLQSFYEHYFPHIWAKPEAAEGVFRSFFARRPFEGSKAFLKKRTMPTFRDGLDAGLKPVSDNPVTLAMLKLEEMGKYIAAQETLKDYKAEKLARFVDARGGKAPRGWTKIEDPIGTVYGPSIQNIAEYPNEGLYTGLQEVADALGVKHKRGFQPMGQALGRAWMGQKRIETKHGTAESVFAHEIGHQIDALAGSGRRFVLEYPDPQTVARLKRAYRTLKDKGSSAADRTAARKELKSLKAAIQDRKEFAKQLRDLADLRKGGSEAYRRSREEKMAQLAQMWAEGREQFERTAPKVFAEWKKFLNENPKLHALRDLEAGANTKMLAQPYDVGGLVIRGHYWAPDGAARILNQYLGPGLSRYSVFRGGMALNANMNLFNLGLSGFHAAKTAYESVASQGGTGLEQIVRGRPIAGVRRFVTAPAAPFTSFMRGIKALNEYYKPGTTGGELGRIVDALTSGGARARMDNMHRTQIAESMTRAWSRGNYMGAALRAPFAGVELPTRVIMDHLVPALKWGTMTDMMRAEFERLGPDADPRDVQRIAKEIVDSVDNRMGEVARDNFFTHRYLKDLSMFLMTADQYFLGDVRELGGAAVDLVRQPANALRGEPVNLKRMAYVGSMIAFHMGMAALYQKFHTGQWPQEGEDYFFPKNGEVDEYGHAQRANMLSYIKDAYSFSKHPKQAIQNRISPAIRLFSALARNRDFYGTEIRHPDDPAATQAGQVAKYVAKQYTPRSVEQLQREKKLGASTQTQVEQFFGITPAPADLDKTPAERLAADLTGNYDEGPRTAVQAERRDLRNTLTRALRNNKPIPKEVLDAMKAGKLKTADVKTARLNAKRSPLARTFASLPIATALKVFQVATPAEKRTLLRELKTKARNALKSAVPADRAEILRGTREALATVH